MSFLVVCRFWRGLNFTLLFMLCALSLRAQSQAELQGTVIDRLGAPVPDAKIVLLQDGKEIVQGKSGLDGSFDLTVPASGRYAPRVEATGFTPETLSSVVLTVGQIEQLIVTLQIGPLTQQIVVSATGTAIPEAQVGASITVIDDDEIQALNKLDVLENLRLVPGAQVVQSGQRGGFTSLFIRGGESDFNKILVDGIPVNDIGGDFDFAQMSNNGVSNVEVLRGANSVLYGSDALSGVVNITSERGSTTVPEVKYSVDAGNFATLHQDVSLGGVLHNFDYFSEFSRFDTKGSLPNSYFHNATVSVNLGWQLNRKTEIRATIRHNATGLGNPNALAFYGIPDNSFQNNHNTYAGVMVQQQTTEKWHNMAQFSFAQLNNVFENPSPIGEPFEGNYLGNVVTIRGANGYSVTGQAILDYGGTYPEIYPDYEARRSIYLQSDYQFFKDWMGIFGFRYEHEDGEGFTRNNYSTFLEGHGSIAHRFFATFGVGLEHNSFFGFAGTPRVSMAYYLRKPTNAGLFGETKLEFNFGKGIKEASTLEQAGALIDILTPQQIAQYKVQPVGPERSRTFDFGVEQRLWNGRSLLGVTFFYNNFYDLISFLNPGALISIGVPPDVANGPAVEDIGGAYVNATSERMKGAEAEYKVDLGHGFLFKGEYTYLDGLVTKAFGNPAINPEFPTIPIGAFDPLEGARPFRRAPHSGSLALFYSRQKFNAVLSGSLVGRRDDSTYLSDPYFGNTMLLPNRNLSGAYQKFDLSGSYDLRPYLKIYTGIENLFSQHYQQSFGYPSLPFTIRSGVTFALGGHQGWWR
ncbi:MAG: TonB-dependent receptor [Candidatus Acidiferrales bacterium]